MDDVSSVARAGAECRLAATIDLARRAWRPGRRDRIALVLQRGGAPGACRAGTLKHQKWLTMPPPGAGIVVHDVHRQED